MERGRVKQFDTPSLLLQDKLGLFYQMVTHPDKYYDHAAEKSDERHEGFVARRRGHSIFA